MKLIPASSPGIQAAHRHTHVRTIVDILMQDWDLLRPIATFLKKYHSCDQTGIEENLDALRLNRSRADVNGTVTTPDHIMKLTQTLWKLYQQNDKTKVNYQRGAIVEQLVCKLIGHRYNQPGELCLTNQRFVEDYKDITVQEVDVAALSTIRRSVEGYECKVSPAAFDPYDCINLDNLAQAAKAKRYYVNVGFVAFENDAIMRIKLVRLNLPDTINIYGLDNLERLKQLVF